MILPPPNLSIAMQFILVSGGQNDQRLQMIHNVDAKLLTNTNRN